MELGVQTQQKPGKASSILVLARGSESDIRVAFFTQTQVHTGGRQISEVATTINRQIIGTLAFKLFKLFTVFAINPAGGGNTDIFVNGLNITTIAQEVYQSKLAAMRTLIAALAQLDKALV